jgi:hypothetical protein
MRKIETLVIALSLLFPSGCTKCQPCGTAPESEPPISRLDREVLETVLLDVLNNREKSPLPDSQNELFFINEPYRGEHEFWGGAPDHVWKEMPAPVRGWGKDTYATMVARKDAPATFKEFKPRDNRIRLESRAASDARAGTDPLHEPPRPSAAWLPGYSADHQHAVVRLLLPWSIHSATGTFFLSKDSGKWRVVWRTFEYYP